ncbi:MAG: hypothetical protein E7371_04570 [Clostridiales bacterium]|nr:hypothetical protein [Clostridiales bacterium]
MKCPKCGKKMKKSTCAKCGYDLLTKYETPAETETPAAPVQPATPAVTVAPTVPTYTPRVNYYTFNPANPNVWYPVSTNAQGQPNYTMGSQIQFATAPIQQPVQQPMQQPVQETVQPVEQKPAETTEVKAETKTEDTDDLATAVGKRAEKAAKRLMARAEKKMTKAQKQRAKAALKAVDKIEQDVPKNIASRLFALLLIGLCVFTFGFLDVHAITELAQGSGALLQGTSYDSMLKMVMDVFSAEGSLFNVLPAFVSNGGTGTAYNLSVYIMALCGVFAVLYALFAVFSKANAPKRVRRSLFFLGAGLLDYTISMSALIGTGEGTTLTETLLKEMNLFNLGGYQVEMIPMAIGGACVVLSFLFLIFRRRVKEQKEETGKTVEA